MCVAPVSELARSSSVLIVCRSNPKKIESSESVQHSVVLEIDDGKQATSSDLRGGAFEPESREVDSVVAGVEFQSSTCLPAWWTQLAKEPAERRPPTSQSPVPSPIVSMDSN